MYEEIGVVADAGRSSDEPLLAMACRGIKGLASFEAIVSTKKASAEIRPPASAGWSDIIG